MWDLICPPKHPISSSPAGTTKIEQFLKFRYLIAKIKRLDIQIKKTKKFGHQICNFSKKESQTPKLETM